MRTIGNFLLLSAVAGVFLTFLPAISAEVSYRYDVWRGQTFYVAGDSPSPSAGQGTNLLVTGPAPLAITPLDTQFGIVVPKIAANARVIANVDPGNQGVYTEALRKGVAHAAGTVYPGQVGNSYLFAHSVGNFWEVNRWNAVFYLLRELNPGDEVDLFYQGRRYIYLVYDKKVVEPNETRYLSAQANFTMLTLQTCWPPGTTLKRLLVFARLKTT
ncbi:class E sortase [Candidatus Microgenomates bacterium]|nr:class E sortase [Candidatus Microgenomates bacterium]